jgi:hypothetical protein
MAMGDVNVVEYGQQAHLALAVKTGLRFSDMLTLRGRVPRQKVMVGVVIDDLICLEKMRRQDLAVTEQTSGLVADAMVEAYENEGLVPNGSKRSRGELKAKFWGASLDGHEGLLRAQLERAVPLAMLTAQVARLGRANLARLQSCSSESAARACLKLLEEIQLFAYEEDFAFQPATVDELWSVVLPAPLFCTDLRAAVGREFSLVDASNEWTAEVSAELPVELAEEMLQHELSKAGWARILSPLKALQRSRSFLAPEEEVPEGEAPVRSHPLWTEVVRTKKFELKARKRIKKREHTNIFLNRTAKCCLGQIAR